MNIAVTKSISIDTESGDILNTLLTGQQRAGRKHIKNEMLSCAGNFVIFSHDMQEYRPTAELMKQSGYQLVELCYEDFRNYFESEFYSICPEMELRMAVYAKCKCLTKENSRCIVLIGGNRRIRTEQEQHFCNMVLKTLFADIIGFARGNCFPVFTNLIFDEMQFHIYELADYFIHTRSRNMRIVLNMTSMERLSAIYSKDELDMIAVNTRLHIYTGNSALSSADREYLKKVFQCEPDANETQAWINCAGKIVQERLL